MSDNPADDRFRSIVEAIPSAIVLVDRERRIRLVNRKAEELFGYAREELLGALGLRLVEEFGLGAVLDDAAGVVQEPEPAHRIEPELPVENLPGLVLISPADNGPTQACQAGFLHHKLGPERCGCHG